MKIIDALMSLKTSNKKTEKKSDEVPAIDRDEERFTPEMEEELNK